MGGVFNSINMDAFHYAGDNPVKMVDPDGNWIDLSKLDAKQKKIYQEAKNYIMKTNRGKELFNKLESSKERIQIIMNKEMNTSYHIEENAKRDGQDVFGTVYWDPKLAFKTKNDGNLVSPAVCLAHELGHAEQDIKGDFNKLRSSTNRLTKFLNRLDRNTEERNVADTERPIAKQLDGEGVRSNYSDVDHIRRVKGGPTLPTHDGSVRLGY